ncbi:MAG: D-sedoheptulose 7-phosphate isomerase [Candidatus Omnitrophota bacterium]
MKDNIIRILEESIEVKKKVIETQLENIIKAVNTISDCFKNKGKIILFGNGGSAADCQHIAAELVGRFKKERRAYPATALTTDSSILTAIGNDYNFNNIFSRQIEALGNRGDVAIGISTSGNSQNIIEAIITANNKGLKTITLTGNGGGKLKTLSNISIEVPSTNTPRIQETHIAIAHIICELVENTLT